MITLESNFLQGFDKVVSKDGLRPQICSILIDEGFLVATDAHILVKINLKVWGFEESDCKNLDQYTIDKEILKELQSLKRGAYIKTELGKIIVYRSCGKKVLKSFELIKDGEEDNFPKYKNIFPVEFNSIESFKVNPQLLLYIYNVYLKNVLYVGGNSNTERNLTITSAGKLKPFVIEDYEKDFYAILMPLK